MSYLIKSTSAFKDRFENIDGKLQKTREYFGKDGERDKEVLLTGELSFEEFITTRNGNQVFLAVIKKDDERFEMFGNTDKIAKILLESKYYCTKRGMAKQIVTAMLDAYYDEIEKTTAYDYPGIFLEGDKFIVAVPQTNKIVPSNDIQEMFIENLKTLKLPKDLSFLDVYFKFFTRGGMDPFKKFVIGSYILIAPFLNPIQEYERGRMKFDLFLCGDGNEGKTKGSIFFTMMTGTNEPLGANSINSDFRSTVFMSRSAMVNVIDDVDALKSSVMAAIRYTRTGSTKNYRGNVDKKVDVYDQVEVFVFTTNNKEWMMENYSNETRAIRLLFTDEDRNLVKQNARQFDRFMRSLEIRKELFAVKIYEEVFKVLRESEYYNGNDAETICNWLSALKGHIYPADGRKDEMWSWIFVGMTIWRKIFENNGYDISKIGEMVTSNPIGFSDLVVKTEDEWNHARIDKIRFFMSWFEEMISNYDMDVNNMEGREDEVMDPVHVGEVHNRTGILLRKGIYYLSPGSINAYNRMNRSDKFKGLADIASHLSKIFPKMDIESKTRTVHGFNERMVNFPYNELKDMKF